MRFWLFFTLPAFWIGCVGAQQPTAEPTATVLTAVAPIYTPIAVLAKVSGDVSVEVTIGSDGKVNATNVLNGNKLLIHTSLEAAKRWRFQTGGAGRKAVLKFSFRILPKGTPEEELSTVFMPPFSIEIRRTIPEQTVNYDPAAKAKKAGGKQ